MKFKPTHLKRYRDLARLLWKYGRSDLVREMDIEDAVEEGERKALEGSPSPPDMLAADLEAMGPTYVKLGQILAGRSDLLSEPYRKSLARLQDKVKPFPFSEVEQIVMTELGARISKAFSRFDPIPVAAASLGQVHLACLRDGRDVAVKVQRPDIRRQIAEDFEVLEEIAGFLDGHTEFGRRYRVRQIVDEFRVTLQQELNYEREAGNLVSMGENLRAYSRLRIPQPVRDYCTRSVLTMEYVDGVKITALSPLVRLELDGTVLAEELFRAYLQQVLVDGLFHADPHPGNVFLTTDKQLALLDLGMVGYTSPAMQEQLLKLLMAVSEGESDAAADIVVRMSQTMNDFDEVGFRRMAGQFVAQHRNNNLEQINVGLSLLEVSKSAAQNGILVPSEFTLLGKTLLQLDQVGKILDPEFDPNASIRRHVSELMTQRMRKNLTPGKLFSSLLDMKDFVGGLPMRLNKIFDAITNAELEVKVKAVDASIILEGFQKIANRITAGIVLAALVVGASLLMQVPSRFHIFGYPGLAILCFVAAAAGGFWLVIKIFIQDHKRKK